MSKLIIYILVLACIVISAYSLLSAPKKSTYLDLAKKLYENGDYKQAIEFIDKSSDKDTVNLDRAYNLRGICNYNLKKYDIALLDLNKSLVLINQKLEHQTKADQIKDLNSIKTNTYFNRALVYQELSELDSAINDYTYVINNDKSNKFAYFNKGFIFYQKQMNDSALLYFSQVLSIDSNDMDALYNQANIYYELNNCEKAQIAYYKLITNKRADEFVYLNMADCEFRNKNYEQSINDYSQSIKINKFMLSAYYNRAQAYKVTKKFNESLKDLKFVLENIGKDINFANRGDEIQNEISNLQKFIKGNK
ncbi:MAG TPA: tetratricopeptide repeat protein [Candidatus Kapabacteria bacterium]|nr:tetratricopeptide repeat protein [Candidatus Kapabacteria bacterium]